MFYTIVRQPRYAREWWRSLGKAEGFEVRGVLTDGEEAVAALTTDLQLMGILVNPTGAGSHVAVVERKIGVAKGSVRGQLNTLSFARLTSSRAWADSDDGQPILDELLNVPHNVETPIDELEPSSVITCSEPLPDDGVQLADESVYVVPGATAMWEKVSAMRRYIHRSRNPPVHL